LASVSLDVNLDEFIEIGCVLWI